MDPRERNQEKEEDEKSTCIDDLTLSKLNSRS